MKAAFVAELEKAPVRLDHGDLLDACVNHNNYGITERSVIWTFPRFRSFHQA